MQISMSAGTIMVDALTPVLTWRVLIAVNVLPDTIFYPTNVIVLEEVNIITELPKSLLVNSYHSTSTCDVYH